MFSKTTLYIPDYVVVQDIPTIINYFEYYNIAKVKKVEVFKHHEPEYYVEDVSNYGFALIEIDYYYINQGAINFYNAIENKKGKIVYDDPKFWEVQFSPFNKTSDLQNYVTTDYTSDEECYYSNEELEEHTNTDTDTDVSTRALDNFNYANYEQNYASFKKKQSSKKQKLNDQLYEIKKCIDNISSKNDKMLKLLLINNKLKTKNQKNKDYKNTWTRRLRINQLLE